MDQLSAVKLWGAIKAWYAEHLPEALESLNPGVREAEFDAFSDEVRQKTGHILPEDMKALYLENDGQKHGSLNGIWLGLEFLALENVREQWQSWCAIAEETDMNIQIDDCTSYPRGAVQTLYACPGWIPLAFDWGGNHFGVDLAPGLQGRMGQVINFGRDDIHKYVMASSLGVYLEWQLEQLKEGNVVIDDFKAEHEVVRIAYLKEPRNKHLLDAVPKLFGPDR